GDFRSLSIITEKLLSEFNEQHCTDTWRLNAIIAGNHGGQSKVLWETLCQRIEKCVEVSNRLKLVNYLEPALNNELDLEHIVDICKQVHRHLSGGGKLGMVTLLLKNGWKRVIQTCRVRTGEPHRPEHFEALRLQAELQIARRELASLWNTLILTHGGSAFEAMGQYPEEACLAIVPEIRRSLEWHPKIWLPLLHGLLDEGLDWSLLEARVPRKEHSDASYAQIKQIATEFLPDILSAELSRRQMREIDATLLSLEEIFGKIPSILGSQFLQAVKERNREEYKVLFGRFLQLKSLQPIYEKRHSLLLRIAAVVPDWAEKMRNRIAPHDGNEPQGDLAAAWRFLRLSSELSRRQNEDISALQQSLEKCRKCIRHTTIELIENLAWGRQIEIVQSKPHLQQALAGWLEQQRRLNSTRIKSVQKKLKEAAQRSLAKCIEAVPVWIMPISSVVDHFDPSEVAFDVVIIDEASQANLMALIPMYMAKSAIIVGDHEQTTPEAVGTSQEPIQNLIDVHLQGIPNCELFDLLTSAYDLARRSFGQTILLTEHFRCVPEIIGFSNNLSYDGQIRPLREESSTLLKPATVAYRVQGVAHKKQNEVEADAIVRLIVAMTKHPSYEEATIGVITLLGEDQARLIDTKLRAALPASEYLARRIVAGNSPQFQGDERDVIFLSLVDSMGEDEFGFLTKKGEGAYSANKKRFNVAASRARNQLWVVHSMDPNTHLHPTDIRRELILYAHNPSSAIDGIQSETAKADSIFEVRVMEMLSQQGYRVKAQWKVGYFRIDIVVEGTKKRLAVECDGDRWHGPEKRDEDLERQAVLERLGWKFVRIRGTCFFLDPIKAMKPVFATLEEMGIERLGPEDGMQRVADKTLIKELEELAWPVESSKSTPNDDDSSENVYSKNAD
ncbi:MAG: DUF559 domain-containing protein, partial [Verrucomicrobia bacterium]|nr:DUF559 domain-containing protein [Verrucomicrobiota bacterium]